MMNYPTPAAVLVSSPRPFGHAVRRSSRSRSGWVLALSFPATFAGHALALQVARTWAPFLPGAVAPRVRRSPGGGWLVSVPVTPAPLF